MDNDTLRGELERLFELDELMAMTRDVLGLSPDDVGGTASKASFARALVERCAGLDAIEAMLDALAAVQPDFDAKVAATIRSGLSRHEELQVGSSLGSFDISRRIGGGPAGTVYVARQGGSDYTLKVLHPVMMKDRGAFSRFATACRLVGRLEHEGLPKGLRIGTEEGVDYVAYEHEEAQTIAARTARSGPMHINEARAILRGLLEALVVLHEHRIAHGNVKPENVLLARSTEAGKQRVVLVDAAYDRLRLLRGPSGAGDRIVVVGDAKTSAPEQIRGEAIDARTDVYSFGAVMYEVLTGKPVHGSLVGVDCAVAHVSRDPEPPNVAGPRGWVTKDVADFVMALLARDPGKRPRDARAVLEGFETLGRVSAQDKADGPTMSDEALGERIDALVLAPDDELAAAALDEAAELGGDASKIAQAFVMAADQIEGTDTERQEVRKSLLFRAARLYESTLKNLEEAEKTYAWIVEIDPSDDIADAALEEVRKQLGKHEEVIEMLLARIERSEDAEERASAMAEIGRMYAKQLDDPGQAVVAYAQAFTESPGHGEYADAIERVAGGDVSVLGEAISMFAEATQGDLPVDQKNLIFLRLGQWYAKKIGRFDAALSCYQAVVATDPTNDGALDGMASVFRSNQQYNELGQVLMRRAEAASSAARAREFRVEAAELLQTRLEQPAKAKELFEQVVAADPGHEKASSALLQIYEREGNHQGVVKLLERKAEMLRGRECADVLVRVGRINEEQLKEYSESVKAYERALEADEGNADALDALDVIYTRSGHFKELLRTLDLKLAIAATPRQRITIQERIARVHEEEFLDHAAAAASLEKILEVDSAHGVALEGLARHYRALDRWDDVASVYERTLKVTTDKQKRLEVLLVLARMVGEHLDDAARAMKVYEEALELEPNHAGALEALAALREQAGDAQAALKAIGALAQKASTPREKAEHYIRAAKLLEERGDQEGAIEHYRLALDANPREAAASSALRGLFLSRGEVTSAIELLSKERDYAESKNVKAKLCAEAAKLARERLQDNTRAEISAKEALEYDANQIDALAILGDLAFEEEHPVEAIHHYDSVVTRLEQIPKERAVVVLRRYIQSLARTDQADKAVSASDQLLEFAPEDVEAALIASQILFEHADPKRALKVHSDMLERFGGDLVGSDKASVLYRHGESARRAGDAVTAIRSLTESADMDPSGAEPLASLAKVHEAKGEWEEVIRIKNRRLDVAAGDERVQMLVEIGEICASKLEDRTRAAKSFMAALEERPDDRKLLARLMQLYSEAKDWTKLVEVVLKLADFVEDPKQKAKYIHTAGIVTGRQLKDTDRAIEFLDKVLELDPGMDAAISEGLEMREQKADYEGMEKLLKLRLDRATEAEDRDTVLKTFDGLAELYQKNLGWMNEAIDAYEAAQMLEPENTARNNLLAELYASNPAEYLDKAVAAQRGLLIRNPNNPEPYKLLRRLHTEAKRADGAWCLCQALAVLNLAEPDEDRFYRRMRSETAAPARDRLTDEDWVKYLMHEDADPILTSLLAVIEPAILATRADTLENLGYDARYAIDLAMHPYPMSQTIYYAAGVLGMDTPPTFQNINDEGGISFLHAQVPSIVLGRAAFEVEVPNQAAAFIVGRHLSYYRPGLYIRHLVPTGTGLKAWVFAAIKMNAPQFPISPDLEGPVNENLKALSVYLTGPTRERLASLVSKLLQSSGALDLKKWVAAVDLTSDRAGLLVAHDLETAAEMIKASDDSISPVTHKDRLREMVLFSISEQYFQLRQRLGIAVDS